MEFARPMEWEHSAKIASATAWMMVAWANEQHFFLGPENAMNPFTFFFGCKIAMLIDTDLAFSQHT